MIPKIIHYCWLSDDPLPLKIQKFIDGWGDILPDYRIVRWDLETVPNVDWVREAFINKKYAFASDYVRFYALYHHGGIYLDSDVEVLTSFNNLLGKKSFIGFETGGDFEAAVIGAEKGSPWIKECLDYYFARHFVRSDGSFDMRPVPLLINEVLFKRFDIHSGNINRLQEYRGVTIYPFEVFSPKNAFNGRVKVTNATRTIHHFEGNWVEDTLKSRLIRFLHRIIIFFLGIHAHNSIVRWLRK